MAVQLTGGYALGADDGVLPRSTRTVVELQRGSAGATPQGGAVKRIPLRPEQPAAIGRRCQQVAETRRQCMQRSRGVRLSASPWYGEGIMPEPLIQKTVVFYGDEIVAVQEAGTGVIYVPVGRLCDNLGIQRRTQMDRLREHEVLSQGLSSITVQTEGGPQSTECLRLDLIPLWLTTINPKRVNEAVRPKLVRYQVEAASVLWAAFRNDVLPATELRAETQPRTGAELALEIATAIQHLAQQQLEIERSLKGVHTRMDGMARFLLGFAEKTDSRLSSLELQLSPQATISEAQAAELALAVKAVGHALAERGTKPGYSQVYGELYRRYGISSYKNLPQGKLAEVLRWLHSWHAELTGEQADTT